MSGEVMYFGWLAILVGDLAVAALRQPVHERRR